jgi:hypothetical protein
MSIFMTIYDSITEFGVKGIGTDFIRWTLFAKEPTAGRSLTRILYLCMDLTELDRTAAYTTSHM